MGALSTFQKMMDDLIRDLHSFSAPYLDDLVIYSDTWEDHLRFLESMFERLEKVNLTVQERKCQFARLECTYLGHVVSQGQIKL